MRAGARPDHNKKRAQLVHARASRGPWRMDLSRCAEGGQKHPCFCGVMSTRSATACGTVRQARARAAVASAGGLGPWPLALGSWVMGHGSWVLGLGSRCACRFALLRRPDGRQHVPTSGRLAARRHRQASTPAHRRGLWMHAAGPGTADCPRCFRHYLNVAPRQRKPALAPPVTAPAATCATLNAANAPGYCTVKISTGVTF